MRTWHKHCLALILLTCCLTFPAECRNRDPVRRRAEKSDRMQTSGVASGHEPVNICSRRRESKLLCYCSPDELHVPVTKAECWIFQNGLHLNDSIWHGLESLRSLRHLKFLVQNTGQLDYIPSKYIEPLSNLTAITIEYAQMMVVKSHAFVNLPNLESITLTSNYIEVIDKDAIANHIFLKELVLTKNQIIEISRFAFRNLPVLEKLYLGGNNITGLHDEVFSELQKLEFLNLEHNQISVLTGDIFIGLGNLKTLRLTGNNLNFIGDTVFAELWSLQELELDDNHIERISERALDGLNNLKTLNLRNNVLKKLDNGLLRGTPALLSINLQSNFLETLTLYNFQPIMDNLVNSTSELLLSENNFICDCRLKWIFDLRNRTKNINLKESLEKIKCTLYEEANANVNDEILSNDIRDGVANRPTRRHGQQRHRQLSSSSIFPKSDSADVDVEQLPVSGMDREYYDDQAPYANLDEEAEAKKSLGLSKSKSGRVVELLTLPAEILPCAEELSDPTELPLSRESIGMDVVRSHSTNKSPALTAISVFNLVSATLLVSCLGLKFAISQS